jgi:predicted PurR-regulated permease PerM
VADEESELHLFTRKVLIVAAVAVGLVFLWSIRRVVILILIAGILAAGVSPAVHRVRVFARHYLGRRIQRGTAVVLVYVPFITAAALFAFFGLPHVLVEGREMAERLPVLIEEKILTPLAPYIPADEVRKVIRPDTEDVNVFPYIKSAVNLVASIVIVLVLIVYMMVDAERLRNLFLLLYPARERGRRQKTILRLSRRMSSWVAGQLLLALIVGSATFVLLAALRIPYAFPLAIVAGIGEMIPVVGPIVSAIPAVILALFLSPWQFWGVLAGAILIQQLENYLLVPRIMGQKISVSPLAIFVAFLIGGSLLGIVGAILAIPVSAIIQVTFEEAFVAQRERRQDPGRKGRLVRGE